MPPKSVKCSICEETTLKSQTLARSDGTRACRSHPGVQEDADKLQAADRDRLRKAVDAPRERIGYTPVDMEEFERKSAARREYIYSHCWTCDTEGISLQDFYLQALVAMKRLEIREEFNILTMHEDIRSLMPGLIPLARIPYDDATDRKMLRYIIDMDLKGILHFLRFMILCPECIRKYGYQKHFEATLPKPSVEQVESILPVMTMVDPLLEKLAEKKERQS